MTQPYLSNGRRKGLDYGPASVSEAIHADFERTSIISSTTGRPARPGLPKVVRCWVSEWQAPRRTWNANANAVAIQHIKRENEAGTRHMTSRSEGISFLEPSA